MTLPTDDVIAQAVAVADAAMDFDALKTAVERFDGCNLKRSARATIFESGKRGADVMVIGSAPSRDDDTSGVAFSGAEGLMLEKMFAAIGLSRHDDIYASFCVPWSPPGGLHQHNCT
ncbi:MAG: uracil-DNA glycosylase family protein [Ahrensia sp.]|nr:uracil-DNA glycosylase family protein [Ahrensia sp.]